MSALKSVSQWTVCNNTGDSDSKYLIILLLSAALAIIYFGCKMSIFFIFFSASSLFPQEGGEKRKRDVSVHENDSITHSA